MWSIWGSVWAKSTCVATRYLLSPHRNTRCPLVGFYETSTVCYIGVASWSQCVWEDPNVKSHCVRCASTMQAWTIKTLSEKGNYQKTRLVLNGDHPSGTSQMMFDYIWFHMNWWFSFPIEGSSRRLYTLGPVYACCLANVCVWPCPELTGVHSCL